MRKILKTLKVSFLIPPQPKLNQVMLQFKNNQFKYVGKCDNKTQRQIWIAKDAVQKILLETKRKQYWTVM